MELLCSSPSLQAYLAELEEVDYGHPLLQKKVQYLQTLSSEAEQERIKVAFEFVRDAIPHSCDILSVCVTCKASEVLQYGEGICCAKAHLLAALLRAQDIPTGFCYQRLLLGDTVASGYCLHGFNAVYIQSPGRWVRLDARGNKPGIQTEFLVAQEKLAYQPRPALGEIDYPTIYAEPHALMLQTLKQYSDCQELCRSLPTEI